MAALPSAEDAGEGLGIAARLGHAALVDVLQRIGQGIEALLQRRHLVRSAAVRVTFWIDLAGELLGEAFGTLPAKQRSAAVNPPPEARRGPDVIHDALVFLDVALNDEAGPILPPSMPGLAAARSGRPVYAQPSAGSVSCETTA